MSNSTHPPSPKRRRRLVALVVATLAIIFATTATALASGPSPAVPHAEGVNTQTTSTTVAANPVVSAEAHDAEVRRLLAEAERLEAARVTRWLDAVAAHEEAQRLEAERLEAERVEAERVAAEKAAAQEAAERRAAEKRAAHERAEAQRRTANTTASPTSGSGWAALRNCESGGNYAAVSSTGKYRGAYQFARTTWDSVASSSYPHLVGVDPAAASPADQDAMAAALYASQGARPWPHCGKHL